MNHRDVNHRDGDDIMPLNRHQWINSPLNFLPALCYLPGTRGFSLKTIKL